MNELITALTRAANAVAEYYERQTNPAVVSTEPASAANLAEAPTPEKKARKPRTPKAAAPAPEAAAPQKETKAAAPVAEMTEDQSKAAVQDWVKMLVQRYPKPLANGVVDGDNNPLPEGYHIARSILANDMKVSKLAELNHTQRLQVIVKFKALVEAADAPKNTQNSNDPAGLGV